MTQDPQAIRPIHYLGSKLRMLDAIREALDGVVTGGGAVCDLFAGSGTVSKYLLRHYDVVSVDIQMYSKVLCEASMGRLDTAPDADRVLAEIHSQREREELESCFQELINYERNCISMARQGEIAPLYEIIEQGSLYILAHEGNPAVSRRLETCMRAGLDRTARSTVLAGEDSMICRYYGGLYFSYEQAAAMDCIAHWVFCREGLLRTKALAALLSTASEVVNTVGKQFAQPLKVRNGKGELKTSLLPKIITDRGLDVYDIYRKWLCYYFSAGSSRKSYTVIRDDYVSALDRLRGFDIAAVYADPPYTRYHYSRYYHVLETICLRDEPKVSTTFPNGKGGISRAIYRADRHQSPFCIKSRAEASFDVLFQKVRGLGVPLVLSYSPFDASKAVTPRLRTIDQLVSKAKEYFAEATVVSPGAFTHSKLNSAEKNFAANHEAERLIICR